MKDYIGDGVYVEWNGRAIVMTTSDGIHVTNTIELDGHTIAAFERFVARVKAESGKGQKPMPQADVYNHPDCVFHYCPTAELCRPDNCQHKVHKP